jgi:hypothetical protein
MIAIAFLFRGVKRAEAFEARGPFAATCRRRSVAAEPS